MKDLDRLDKTVEDFCQFIEKLSDATLVEQEWGPKEVLAHLVYHHEGYVPHVEAIISGTYFQLPVDRFRDLNAQAVAASRGIPIADLLTRLRDANCRFRSLSLRVDTHKISLEIKEGSKPWILAELIPAIEAHIRNHQKKLRIPFKEETTR